MKWLLLLCMSFPFFAQATIVTLAEQTVTFAPTNGYEVKRAFIGFRCLRQSTFWEGLNSAFSNYTGCYNYQINGIDMPRYHYEENVELKKIGPNQFMLDAQKVDFSNLRKGHLCLRVIASLDSGEFAEPNDEWSLFGFCTVDKLPFDVNSNVYNNHRKATMSEFKTALYNPIVIKTK